MQQGSCKRQRRREFGAKGLAWGMLFATLAMLVSIAFGVGACASVAGTPPLSGWVEFERDSVVFLEAPDGTTGSGFMAAPGFVVTAAHVTAATDEFKVTARNGWVGKGKVLQRGDPKALDFAILQLEEASEAAELMVPNLATMETQRLPKIGCRKLKVGDRLRAWGSGTFSKDLTVEMVVSSDEPGPAGTVIVSGQIVPGMSGGPVFDEEHDIVGLNVGSFGVEVWGLPHLTVFSVILPMARVCRFLKWE